MAVPAETYIALDLETTGTNPQNDRIIEIGAVRFTPEGVSESFQTYVNPGRTLPYRVHVLTGINDDDLRKAPPLAAVAADLERFVGSLPIVGQSVDFDLAFLKQNSIHLPGAVYDTFELASLYLPEARDYGLKGLAEFFAIPFAIRHRAEADARAAADVFLALRHRLKELPRAILEESLRLSIGLEWQPRGLLEELLGGPQLLFQSIGGLALEEMVTLPPAESEERAGPRAPVISAGTSARYLRNAGGTEAIEDFEDRPQQLQMAAAVEAAFSEPHHLLVEAGTGTGKSLAYLVPAALHAVARGERVVVSTDTINLQEQLTGKDIPALRKILAGAPGLGGLRTTTMKGRRNYLCLLRWAQARREPPSTTAELAMLIRLLVWAPRTQTGDRAELNISQGEDVAWSRLSAQNENCLSGPCQYVKQGTCFLLRARRRAEASDILVVNHSLLLADLAADGGVLPQYQYLVADEAHNLEEEATNAFGFETSRNGFDEFLDSIAMERPRFGGLVASTRAAMRSGKGTIDNTVPGLLDALDGLVARARPAADTFFDGLARLLLEAGTEGETERRIGLTGGTRAQPGWSRLEISWDNMAAILYEIEEKLLKLFRGLVEAHSAGAFDAETATLQVDAAAGACQELTAGVSAIMERHDPERVCWIAQTRRGDVELSSAPLSVSGTLRARLFDQKSSVILTSATLTAGGDFSYLKDTLGVEGPEELLLGSPFDFERSALLLLPTDFPEPAEAGYQQACDAAVLDLASAAGGRSLALFTSHSALRATYHSIRGRLEEQGIQVLAQGLDGSAKQLISALRENHRTLLMGTASFWEGVDIAGEALSMLIIAKLPFPVPTDPIFAARSELYEDPFNEFALPQAVLRFKQGFGRLIRHRDDRGVVAALDRRLMSRSYGSVFLQSLPPCTQRRLPSRSLGDAAAAWLGAVAESSAPAAG
ncbi:MAG: helicase C-terminal domain-containing protein [Dehalococcoidia bacterium]